jgi:hypothetical protein
MLETLRPWFEHPLFLIPVTATITACVAEPLKIFVSNRFKRRQLRRIIVMEIISNLRWLHKLHKGGNLLDPSEQGNFGDPTCLSSTRAAYDNSVREFYLYYQLSEHEWVDGFYSSLQKLTRVEDRIRPMELACEMESQCIAYLQRHPGTWSLVGADSPLFLRKQIRPTCRIAWIRGWRKLKSDLRTIRSRTESHDDEG